MKTLKFGGSVNESCHHYVPPSSTRRIQETKASVAMEPLESVPYFRRFHRYKWGPEGRTTAQNLPQNVWNPGKSLNLTENQRKLKKSQRKRSTQHSRK